VNSLSFSLEQKIPVTSAHFLLAQIYAESGDATRAEAERRESERWHREVN